MNIRILNRDGQLPTDNWYEVEVVGQHYNAGSNLVQIIDARAVEHIVNRFTEEAKAENFAGMRVGKDHLADDLANSTEALGWMMEMRNRDGKPEGRIEWTAVGLPLIEAKPGRPPAYKFFTTEYNQDETEPAGTVKIRNREVRAVRPLRLDGLDVTNKPNNRGGKPISNRDPGASPERSENQPNESTMNPKVLKLLAALGVTLAPDAAAEAQEAALDQALAKAAEMPGIKNRLATFEADNKRLLETQMAVDLDARKDRIKNRESVERMYRLDREGTLALLDEQTPAEPPARITNRSTAKTPAEIAAAAKAEKDDAELAGKIRNRRADLQAKGMSFQAAHAQATTELRGA